MATDSNLGKYQRRERRVSGAWLECLIKREGPTPVTMDGFQYIFSPDYNGRCVTYVQNPAHVERLLSDPTAYREIFPDRERAEAKKAGDLPVAGDDDDKDGASTANIGVTDEQYNRITTLYFDERKPMKEIANLPEFVDKLNRPTISAVIHAEKTKRNIL